jgi:uroporphyrinogen decarboxylase
MTKRENLIRALRRREPESVPFYFSLCPSLVETFKAKTGSDDYLDYFDIPIRFANLLPSRQPADYSRYYPKLPPGTVINKWGVAHVPGSLEHFTKMLHPMENFTTVEEI